MSPRPDPTRAGLERRAAELRRAARLADLALDWLQWCHCAYAGDDVEEVKALAATAKIALENALYGLGTDPLEPVEEWMLPRPGWARQ